MAPILDLNSKIANLFSIGNVLDLLYLIFTILIFVIGFYVYFKVEKDKKTLLIAIGFLCFFIAGLAKFTTLFDDNLIAPWPTVWNFLGALVVLIAVEPMKAYKNMKK